MDIEEVTEGLLENPKLFISYSWTGPEHMDWVLRLATDLRANGVNAVLDKWHLREGQDAHSFMEQMVTDPTVSKVLLICDQKYVERADQREGGVGAESQIMSGELYGKIDQTKFVALCTEGDENGRAYLPAFMKSRIYIDFRDIEQYAQNFEQLLRWCFDKPLYIEPELGKAPVFLDTQAGPVARDISIFERSTAQSTQTSTATAAANFFRGAANTSSDMTVDLGTGSGGDELIHDQIIGLAPTITRILDVLDRSTRDASAAPTVMREYHSFLEALLANYEKGKTQWSGDVTKFYGQFLVTCFVAVCVRNDRLEEIDQLLSTPFALYEHDGITARSTNFGRMNSYLHSLEARNSRLNLRRASLHSDLIKHVCELTGMEFRDYMQADLLLYLRAINSNKDLRWWPDSLLYAADKYGSFPWFIRAMAPPFRERLLGLFGIRSKAELDSLISKFESRQIETPRWQSVFSSIEVLELANLKAISETM